MPEDITGIIEEAIKHYRPGGEFAGVRTEQLAEKKATIIPEMRAELVGRGLAGTTVGAAIPGRFEREVAKPWRTETEMLRSARLMEAILSKAGFMERAEARQSTEDLAREEMELRERLQSEALSAQERFAAEQRLHEIRMQQRAATGGAGTTIPWGSYGALRDTGGDAGAGAGAGAGIGQHPGAYPSPFDGGDGAIPEGWRFEPGDMGGTWSPLAGPGEPGYDPSQWAAGGAYTSQQREWAKVTGTPLAQVQPMGPGGGVISGYEQSGGVIDKYRQLAQGY